MAACYDDHFSFLKMKSSSTELSSTKSLLRAQLGDDNTLPESFQVTTGQEITLNTNIYPLISTKITNGMVKYSVKITPEVRKASFVRHLVYSAVCPNGGKMSLSKKWSNIIYDGNGCLYSMLSDLSCEYTLPTKSEEETKYIVQISKVKGIDSTDIRELLQIYNIIIHRGCNILGFSQFKKKWINFNESTAVGAFKVYNGFVPTISTLSQGISCFLKATSRIDRSGTLYDFLKKGITSPSERNNLCECAKIMQIITSHTTKPKLIQIAFIDWETSPYDKMFERVNPKTKETTKISVAGYFQQTYNIKLMQDDPLINCSSKDSTAKHIIYPASVLKVTGLTEAEHRDTKLNRDLKKQSFANVNDKKKKLDIFISSMKANKESNSYLTRWGFTIQSSVSVTGHVLPPPALKFRNHLSSHNEVDIYPKEDYNIQREVMNAGVAVPPSINAIPLVLTPESCANDIKTRFIDTFVDVAQQVGILMNQPEVIIVSGNSNQAYRSEIINYIQANGTPSFIIVIMTETNKDRYDSIKTLLSCVLGIPSQFCRSQTLFNDKPGLAEACIHLIYQITAKTGGVPYYISPNVLPLKSTMIVGISVSKKTTNSTQCVCAMTATYDHTLARIYSDTFIIKDNEKGIPETVYKEFLTAAFERFNKQFGSKPARIVVYRDAIGYLQIPQIKTEEIPYINRVIGDISLVYCIVKKKNHLQILSDAALGTIISDKVGIAGVAEFYLISGKSAQGFPSPTRYTVIHHSPQTWKDDHFALLTHYLTCHYPNCTRPVRVPAPLKLASRLAEFTRSTLNSKNPHEFLREYAHFV